jgi:hypothetical protein
VGGCHLKSELPSAVSSTPEWAAQAIVEEFWPNLSPGKDLVLKPSCGRGAFLQAVPRGGGGGGRRD